MGSSMNSKGKSFYGMKFFIWVELSNLRTLPTLSRVKRSKASKRDETETVMFDVRS